MSRILSSLFGSRLVFPAEAVEDFVEEMAAVGVRDGADTGNDTVDVAVAVGGELVGGGETFAFAAVANGDEAGIDDGADKGNAVSSRLAKAFLGVQREVEFLFEEMADNVNVAQELRTFGGGNDDEEIINIATVVRIAEVVDNETVELVEENVGEKLGSQIANDDTAALGLVKEAF